MKLVVAVVDRADARGLADALTENGHRYTEIANTGGLLSRGNMTLLVVVPDEHVDEAIELIQESCHAREEAVNVAPPDTRLYVNPVGEAMTVVGGGAQVFVLNVERVVDL